MGHGILPKVFVMQFGHKSGTSPSSHPQGWHLLGKTRRIFSQGSEKSGEEVAAAGRAGWAYWDGSFPRRGRTWILSIVPNELSSSEGEWLGLELPDWIVSCLLLKGLCIPLSTNLFMAHG